MEFFDLKNPNFLLLLALIAGTFCHWVKKRYRDGLPGGPIDYLIANPRHTFAMATGVVTAWSAAVATGTYANAEPIMAIASGWGIGWALDSSLNKGPGQ